MRLRILTYGIIFSASLSYHVYLVYTWYGNPIGSKRYILKLDRWKRMYCCTMGLVPRFRISMCLWSDSPAPMDLEWGTIIPECESRLCTCISFRPMAILRLVMIIMILW
ncbi:hypothetical protein DFH27DRAFT_346760 [Peziza echinospora]|nr:hypothetical protein DFH27DRAFT_346760 [Peziza echinospora]